MRKIIFLLIFSLGIILFYPPNLFGDTYIIVIDTSLSMNRKVIDNTRVYDVALKSLSNSIFYLKNGDVVYIVDFNENVYIRPPITIKDNNTKEVIFKVMKGTQPYGKWTFTYKMLEEIALLIKTNNISPKNSKVIIISDGIDDPPIKNKKYFANLEKLSTMFDPHQLIYYISLEKLIQEKSSQQPKIQKETAISKKIKSIQQINVVEVETTNQASEALEKSFKGEKIVLKDITTLLILIVLVLATGSMLILRYIYLPSKAKRVSDVTKLLCSSPKSKKTIPLKGYKIVLGNSKGKFSLPNWTYNGKVIIKASTKGYRIFFTSMSGVSGNIANGKILGKGDTFGVGNYTFEVE